MKVSVKCFAQLAEENVCNYRESTTYEMPEEARIDDLIDHLGLAEDEIKLIYVNHIASNTDTTLRHGDNVAFAPASGGM